MDTKEKIIAETADVTVEEAKMALELADGDIDKAVDMVPYVEKTLVLLHGKFVCGRNKKLYGLFRLLGNGKEGQLLDFGLAMSYIEDDVDSPINANPVAFRRVIDQLFKMTETTQVHTFLAEFYDNIGPAQVNRFYHYVRDKRKQELERYLSDLISKIWGGSERVDTTVETFLITKIQAEKKGLIAVDIDESDDEGDDGSGLTISLETEPIISAVQGKTAEKFSVDELIPLKITDDREVGRYLANVLANEAGLVVGRIRDIYFKELSGRYIVTVEFGPKINGRFVIEPSVRLATYGEMEPKIAGNKEGVTTSDLGHINPVVFLLMGMILMLLFFFIFTR